MHRTGTTKPDPVTSHSWARLELAFLALVLTQMAHSLEEYRGRVYDVFPPARYVTSLVSTDRRQGFVILNVALAAFGLWCVFWPTRRQWSAAVPLAWAWVAIELVNGVGHPIWSLREGGYTPGVATAPFLLVIAIYLGYQLLKHAAGPQPEHSKPT
jgi:Protein of unknown function with HXXEE motif